VTTSSSLPPDWIHGEFVYSLQLGIDALLSELWNGSISQAAWMGLDVKCMSPNSFLDLVEKYFVWLQLCSKRFQNTILPANLLRSIICRKCTGYANTINLYFLQQDNPTSSRFCRDLLQTLVNSLIKTISCLSENVIEKWSKAANIRGTGDWTSTLHSFTERLVILIFVYFINVHPSNHQRESNFKKMKFHLSANYSIYRPTLVNQLGRFQMSLANIYKFCVKFFEQTDSPLECSHINLNFCGVPRYASNEGIKLRKIIVVEADNFISVVDPQRSTSMEVTQTVNEPTHEEGAEGSQTIDIETPYETKQENAAEPPRRPPADLALARDIIKRVRDYLRHRNSPKGMIWKSCEKILLESGVDIDSPQTLFYLDALCPLIGTLRDTRTALDNQIQKLLVSSPLSLCLSLAFF
jgi:hypothetical protein